MAANAAHFTTTSQTKPSIFEIMAQHSLNTTLHPAFERVATFVASTNPTKLLWVSEWYDEIYLALNGLLQYHYIKTYGASFAETFYGLRRLSTKTNELSTYDRNVSLALLLLLPYAKRKLYERLEEYRVQSLDGLLADDLRGRAKRLACNARATFELVWGGLTVLQYVRYMSGRTDVATPTLRLLNLKLTYNATDARETTGFWTPLLKGELSLSQVSFGLLMNAVSTAFEVSAFFVQFLQSWHTEKLGYNLSALPIVPPPVADPNADNYKDKCPLCLQTWKIPTVLPTSGYVFCFSCIVRHLRESAKCPVTNLPARTMDIIRIYDST